MKKEPCKHKKTCIIKEKEAQYLGGSYIFRHSMVAREVAFLKTYCADCGKLLKKVELKD